jgi:hypothetical protein
MCLCNTLLSSETALTASKHPNPYLSLTRPSASDDSSGSDSDRQRFVLPCRVLSCLILPCLALSCRVVSCRVVWCGVVWCGVVSCGVVWCRVVSCLVLSCRVLNLSPNPFHLTFVRRFRAPVRKSYIGLRLGLTLGLGLTPWP